MFTMSWCVERTFRAVLIGGIAKAASSQVPAESDRGTLTRFVSITIALALVFGVADNYLR